MTNNPERLSTRRELPVLELDEIELTLISPAEVQQLLRAFAESNGVEAADVLYTGIDLDDDDPINRGFGTRTETWAFTDAEVAKASKGRSSGDYDAQSPLYYALSGTSAPGVVLTDASKFTRLGMAEDYGDRIETEYRLKDGLTFDDAVIGILRITAD